MLKQIKALACTVLCAIVVLSCMAFPVSAVTATEIKFDETGVFKVQGQKGDNWYTYKPSKTGQYFFRADTAREIIIEEPTGYQKSRDDGCIVEMLYEGDDYKINISLSKAGTINITRFDGYFKASNDDHEFFPNEMTPMTCDEGKKITVSFVSTNEKQKIYNSLSTDSGYNTTQASVEVEANQVVYFNFIINKAVYSFSFSIYRSSHPSYTCDKLRHYLVEKGSDLTIDFDYTDPAGKEADIVDYFTSADDGTMHFSSKAIFNDIQSGFMVNSFLMGNMADGYYTDTLAAAAYVYTKDKTGGEKIELDKEYKLHNETHGVVEQICYSFTPDKDGIYNLSSKGSSTLSHVALYDSNDKYLGSYDSNYNTYDEGMTIPKFSELQQQNKVDYNFNYDVSLKKGQTYYFYVLYAYQTTEDLNVKLTLKSETQPSNPSTPSTPVVSTTSGTFEDFVERLYVVALERPSEPEGKAFWCEKVQDGTYDGAYCARFFLTSPEFLGKNKTDEQFVDTLYRTFFNREADDEGRAFWIKKIKESSKETVIEGFINSTEWCNICASYGVKSGAQWAKATVASANATAFAERLYTECLGRPAEEDGLKYWSLSLTNLERTGTQAAKEFFYSEEFLGKKLNNEEYVLRLYKTFMGREPEAEGKAYWLDLLNNGGSRDEVFNFFASCPEFTEICTKYAIDR